jgi:hypothetical protein
VSTLASCGRLPATVPDLANRPRQLVFLTRIDSQLNDFLNEIHQIARSEPSIVERIDEDLDLHAKKKKLLRLADAEFLAGQTLDLPKLQLQLRELKIDDIELETGRPRTEAYIVYLFLMLRGFEQTANVCERRVMEQEKVPVAEKIISLSDSDASFIVKGGWNTVVGYRPQLARSGQGFVTALVLPRGNAADSPHLVTMVKEQITNTGVTPSMSSADDGYSTQQGREEVLGLGLKVVSISGAKGKKLIEVQQSKSRPYR